MITSCKALWNAWMDALYPPHCIGCDRLVGEGGAYLCGGCWETIDRQRTTSSSQCTGDPEAEVVLGAFQGPLREAIHALKFRHKRGLGRALGRHMARAVGPKLAHVDGIIPLPLHPARVRERGYNQSFEIAFGMAEALDVPLVRGWVVRTQNTRQQSHLNAEERRANVRLAFCWRGVPPGRAWALVDDVITTGATISACINAFPGRVEDIVPTALARSEVSRS